MKLYLFLFLPQDALVCMYAPFTLTEPSKQACCRSSYIIKSHTQKRTLLKKNYFTLKCTHNFHIKMFSLGYICTQGQKACQYANAVYPSIVNVSSCETSIIMSSILHVQQSKVKWRCNVLTALSLFSYSGLTTHIKEAHYVHASLPSSWSRQVLCALTSKIYFCPLLCK